MHVCVFVSVFKQSDLVISTGSSLTICPCWRPSRAHTLRTWPRFSCSPHGERERLHSPSKPPETPGAGWPLSWRSLGTVSGWADCRTDTLPLHDARSPEVPWKWPGISTFQLDTPSAFFNSINLILFYFLFFTQRRNVKANEEIQAALACTSRTNTESVHGTLFKSKTWL